MCRDVVAGMDKSERMIRFALANTALFRFPAARLHLVNSLVSLRPRCRHATARRHCRTDPDQSSVRSDVLGHRPPRLSHRRWMGLKDAQLRRLGVAVPRALRGLASPGWSTTRDRAGQHSHQQGPVQDLRRGIAPTVEIVTVTSLPPVTFASAGTSTKTSVLHLRKTHARSASHTIFAVCEDIGYTVANRDSRRSKQHTSEGDLPAILATILGWAEGADCRDVQGVEDSSRWDAGFHATLPLAIQRRLDAPLFYDLRLEDVAYVSTDRVDPRKVGRLDLLLYRDL